MDDSLLLDLKETCVKLRIRRSLLYRLLRTGELKGLKIGRRRLISRTELQAYVDRKQELQAQQWESGGA